MKKTCSKCGEEKDVGLFRKGCGRCKACIKEYYKEWREANSERIREQRKEYDKQYNKANAHNIKEWHKEYYKANSERLNERYKEYNKANAERIKEYRKEYKKANKEQLMDSYVKELLKSTHNIHNPSPELIELKRIQLTGIRTIKNLQNGNNK